MYEIFAQLCKQHGVTPYKVSKETGVSQPTLSEWKKGTYTPKQDKLQKIADYFGVTLDYLMGNTHADEQTPPEMQKAPTLNKKDERDIKRKWMKCWSSLIRRTPSCLTVNHWTKKLASSSGTVTKTSAALPSNWQKRNLLLKNTKRSR